MGSESISFKCLQMNPSAFVKLRVKIEKEISLITAQLEGLVIGNLLVVLLLVFVDTCSMCLVSSV